MELFLGIDAGGTKTAAVIINSAGQEQARGEGGAGNVAAVSDAILRCSLSDAVGSACQAAGIALTFDFAGVCAGIAGYSVVERRTVFHSLLQEFDPMPAPIASNRIILSPIGEPPKGTPGVVVIAGTGSSLVWAQCRRRGVTARTA